MDASAMARLRAAVYARDGASVVAVLTEGVVAEVPQPAGDGLLSAIGQMVPGAGIVRALMHRPAARTRKRR